MPADNLSLAIRIRADMQQALAELDRFNARLDATRARGREAGHALHSVEQAARSAGEAHEVLGARMQEACDTAYATVRQHVAARESRIDTTHAELARLRRDVEDAANATRGATVDAFRAMEDAVAEFATTGRLSFAALFDTVIAEMARLAVHRTVTRPLSDLLFGALSGVSGAGGGTSQPALFDGAPRFHSGGIAGLRPDGGVAGLRPDEVPAILQRGEGVFTPAQMRALGTPDVLFSGLAG